MKNQWVFTNCKVHAPEHLWLFPRCPLLQKQKTSAFSLRSSCMTESPGSSSGPVSDGFTHWCVGWASLTCSVGLSPSVSGDIHVTGRMTPWRSIQVAVKTRKRKLVHDACQHEYIMNSSLFLFFLPPFLPFSSSHEDRAPDVTCSSCQIDQWVVKNHRHISLFEWVRVSFETQGCGFVPESWAQRHSWF